MCLMKEKQMETMSLFTSQENFKSSMKETL